jgi:hypothetical protein
MKFVQSARILAVPIVGAGAMVFRILNSPRLFVKIGRVVLMYWPYEKWNKRIEMRVR